MRDDREKLLDVREAIEKIEKYTVRGEQAFKQDELVQTWIVHHLEIMGEAVRSLSPALRNKYPKVPWAKIIGMRNILVHHYFGIDVAAVWSVAQNELPRLRRDLDAILKDLKATP
ncbi:MAG: DUF86 domain-containing protein [Acidobacteriia bacterium]|nr:DUF86 domain-containing protein [Terriglobia bacterium]